MMKDDGMFSAYMDDLKDVVVLRFVPFFCFGRDGNCGLGKYRYNKLPAPHVLRLE